MYGENSSSICRRAEEYLEIMQNGNHASKVSVLMSVYNDAPYLREAVDSILNQTFTDFEFIVVDDASTDETPSILDSYTDSRIVRLHNTVNLGLTKSLNRGLSIAKGEYIVRQDANDISLPGRVAKQLSFMETKPQTVASSTDYIQFWQEVGQETYVRMPQTDSQIREKVFYAHVLCHAGAMLKRSGLQEIGGYNEAFELAQDRDLWLRLLEYSKLANLPEPLYKVRMVSGSITTAKRAKQRCFARQAVLNALERGVLQPEPVALGRFYWQASLDELAINHKTKAKGYLQQAIMANKALEDDVDYLMETAVNRAFEAGSAQLSHKKSADDITAGVELLNSLFAMLPTEEQRLKQYHRATTAQLYAAYAFAAFRYGQYTQARNCCLRAWLTYSSQLRNRGLWSVYVRSLSRYFNQ